MHLANDSNIFQGLLGGTILGISTLSYQYLTGRLSGLSGIVSTSAFGEKWASFYIIGLVTSGALVQKESNSDLHVLAIAISGILVGFGSRYGNGCTSGHGLCGLSRFSPRSAVAVVTFMASAALSAYLTKSTFIKEYMQVAEYSLDNNVYIRLLTQISCIVPAVFYIFKDLPASEKEKSTFNLRVADYAVNVLASLLFGYGLQISGMCNPERVLRFLNFSGSDGWDPTLIGVMGSGVIVNALGFYLLRKSNATVVLSSQKKKHADLLAVGTHVNNMKINTRLLIGSILFGIGWGIAGICPGPALVSFGAATTTSLIFVPFMFAGMFIQKFIFA